MSILQLKRMLRILKFDKEINNFVYDFLCKRVYGWIFIVSLHRYSSRGIYIWGDGYARTRPLIISHYKSTEEFLHSMEEWHLLCLLFLPSLKHIIHKFQGPQQVYDSSNKENRYSHLFCLQLLNLHFSKCDEDKKTKCVGTCN